MKHLKLMLLMAFFSFAFTSITFGQTAPASKYLVTRNACNGFSGCYSGNVTMRIDNGGSPSIGGTNTFNGTTQTLEYPSFGTKIKLTIASVNSTGIFSLPTVTGDPLVINGSEGGVPGFTVIITKTANREYTLQVSDNLE